METLDRKERQAAQAASFSRFDLAALDDTGAFLDAIGVAEGDSVLDVCCGAGRISIAAVRRGAACAGFDSSAAMVGQAQQNAADLGYADACSFRQLEWSCVLPGQNVVPADVAIACRAEAKTDVEKLSALGIRTAAVQVFADAPTIPALMDVLFSGCKPARKGGRPEGAPEGEPAGGPDRGDKPAGGPGPQGGRPGPAGPGAPGGRPAPGGMPPFAMGRPQGGAPAGGRKPVLYKEIVDKVYAAGYDPNVAIMPERFRKAFATVEEACAWVASLSAKRAEGNEERVALNAAPFIRPAEGGVEFCMATKAAVIWWDVRKAARYF